VRLAILTDIHEDYTNLQKVLKRIDKKGRDLTICLGDISGFSEPFYRYRKTRNASACLALIREKCDIIIPGNHDLHVAKKIPEQTAGTSHEFWEHDQDLDPGYSMEEIAFLAGLPDHRVLPTQDYRILLSHYARPNLSGFIKGFYKLGTEFESHFEWMQKINCRLGFTGHAHPRGFYTVTPRSFEHFGYRRLRLKEFPVIVGIPPVTRLKYRSGFCIFDTDSLLLQVIKIY
jgi:predicted phosphodiesterase